VEPPLQQETEMSVDTVYDLLYDTIRYTQYLIAFAVVMSSGAFFGMLALWFKAVRR
jgi:hypothetical protein